MDQKFYPEIIAEKQFDKNGNYTKINFGHETKKKEKKIDARFLDGCVALFRKNWFWRQKWR